MTRLLKRDRLTNETVENAQGHGDLTLVRIQRVSARGGIEYWEAYPNSSFSQTKAAEMDFRGPDHRRIERMTAATH